MSVLTLNKCPQCGAKALEDLSTYSHCCNCLHIVDPPSAPAIPLWLVDEYKTISKQFDRQFSRANGVKAKSSLNKQEV